MTDFDWGVGGTSVRGYSCANDEENNLGIYTVLYKPDYCAKEAKLIKKNIQDKELYGVHKVYCYPWNITIEGEHHPCPAIPFEMEGKVTYKIANIEHYGKTTFVNYVSTSDLHLSKELTTRLKADYASLNIQPLNMTTLDLKLNKLVARLRGLPESLALSENSFKKILTAPYDFFKDVWNEVMKYIEEVGIVIGILAVMLVLVLVMPALQIFVGITHFLGNAVAAWSRLVTRTITWFVTKTNKKKAKYWDPRFRA